MEKIYKIEIYGVEDWLKNLNENEDIKEKNLDFYEKLLELQYNYNIVKIKTLEEYFNLLDYLFSKTDIHIYNCGRTINLWN